ncbi:MAG: CvpA family protein, partial [Lachnospiraceae bacterium]|nr:CvpA family protein [Lachnospiraceae bacterium]
QLLTIETREFTEDIKEADYRTVPLLDKASASILGNRKMGSMVDMVSQFEVAEDYTQLNYQGKPVRVTPLVYADTIKWLTNQSEGIPAYIRIDMTTQDTECVQLTERIKYSKSEYFNRNIYRHLRFQYPTYIFDDQIFFEIDDEGVPYWICPVKRFNIGLFGGQTVGNVVICNAVTGECTDYPIGEVPQWVDKVFSAERLIELYDYAGTLKHGFWNSKFGQRDCLQTSNGYNYIALEDDVWVYTGVTSVSGDQSNVGFVLMNQRTMETRYYQIEGAIEDSAMYSAQGQVQHLGYQATFPLLLNIADEPTYFMALKDSAGLVKQYAMVNVQKYQWVAIGSTVMECEKNYMELLNTNGIVSSQEEEWRNISGTITTIAPIVVDGTSHYYLYIEGNDAIFDVDLGNEELLPIIGYQVGDRIRVFYEEGYGVHEVRAIEGV